MSVRVADRWLSFYKSSSSSSSFSSLLVRCLLLAACLALTAAQTGNGDIVFTLKEELKADTRVGNVAEASGIRSEVTTEEFNQLRYQILSSNSRIISSLFTINSRTGTLLTNAMIDREDVCDSTAVTCPLKFDVTVKLEIVVIKVLKVVVIIEDVNDNPPEFPNSQLPLSISEGSPKDSEISITGAIDRDAGIDSEISYWMSDNDVFGLREEKLLDVSVLKIVLLQTLDRETESNYELEIYAKDGNTTSALTGTLSVTITVTDMNDHSPVFSKATYNFTAKENAARGSLVGTVVASDRDAGENGRVTYHFSSLTARKFLQFFSLDNATGHVTVKDTLQYESGEKFQAVVEAKDHGGSPRAAQAIVLINVKDAGNTPPKLELTLSEPLNQDSTILSEDLPIGSFVGTLKYLDTDEGENGEVMCESMNIHFSLQALNGAGEYKIEIKTPLDREALSLNDMTVILKCTDRGTPRLSAFRNFSVIISDSNDNSPIFSKPEYFGNVTEGRTRKTNVVRVSATDADEGANSELTYHLTANSSNSFSVDPFSGVISQTAAVDRESGPVIRLTVLAVDKGDQPLTGSAVVSVAVADVNDNTPEIIRTEYQVKENLEPGAFVAQILASDDDENVNGDMRFELVSDPELGFLVSDTGTITTTSKFDRETVAHYFIVVAVHDLGTPPLSSTSTLTISISDANDFAPQIRFPVPGNDSIEISANLSPGTVIARAVAVDEDVGKNAKLIYLIAEGNPHKAFSIDNATGAIFISKRLTTTRTTAYRLTISVQDSGNPRMHNKTFLYINIDFTNATLLSDENAMEQKYVIIAGIIAGITVVIAIIVIAIILKLRRSDMGRGPEPAPKAKTPTPDHHRLQDTSKVSMHGLSTFSVRADDKEAGFGEAEKGKGRDPNTSFESHLTNGSLTFSQRTPLTLDMLDRHGNQGFSLFPEGRPRLASEDLHSDTSGEATASDSGRGASDGEDTGNTGASPPLPVHSPVISPTTPLSGPRVPQRPALPGNQRSPLPGPVYSPESSSSLSDLSRAARAYASHKDLDKGRKTPSKVRFSFDDQSLDHIQQTTSGHPHPHHPSSSSSSSFNYPHHPSAAPTKAQLLRTFMDQSYPRRHDTNNSVHPGMPQNFSSSSQKNSVQPFTDNNKRNNLNPTVASDRLYLDPRGIGKDQSVSRIPLSRDAVAKHERFHQKGRNNLRPPSSSSTSSSLVKDSNKTNSFPLLHPQQHNPHHHHQQPLSPLNHSIDEDDDDGGSTTTSGSYAIDGMEDALNISVEC
ncbi:protocadherin gamma-A4 [Aplysia californica]|uniref:Protocadherin gamma-A4 n=1 Tax=Aplysia californica TaxID=6500 RepID=A0ABM0K9H5_APLCA|nr:protocadherin gamma-A4 [Aplysia californica]